MTETLPRPPRIEPGPGQESVWDYPRPPRVEAVHERLRVVIDGVTVADTTHGRRVLETAGAPVYYFPPEDVRMDLLEPSDTRTVCAYKGRATYHSLAGVTDAADLAWSYPDPLHDAEPVRDLVCFYAEWTDLVADGVPVPRPESPFTRRGG